MNWGSSDAGAKSTVRPLFRGRLAWSRVDGRLVRVHRSRLAHQARLVVANGLFLVLIVGFATAVVRFSWNGIECRFSRHTLESADAVANGAVYSVLTVILHAVCNLFAYLLTEAENHRFEERWETSVFVKKWMLTVIVQTWAVGYLLFARPWLWPCAYGDTEVRLLLGVDNCPDEDGPCCEAEIWMDGLNLHFADVRRNAILAETRQFVAGWLISRIFVYNLCTWLIPRLLGFVCMRGIYPCVVVDFAQDIASDLTASSQRQTHAKRALRCCCCRRRRADVKGSAMHPRRCGPASFSKAPLSQTNLHMKLPPAMIEACEFQLELGEPWNVLDSVNDLSVNFFVTSCTTVVYPFAPFLFLANLIILFQMDLYRLFSSRQPKPQAARGLPRAWIYIFQSYVYLAAAWNLAVVTYRTSLVKDLFDKSGPDVQFGFLCASLLLMVLVINAVQLVVPSVPLEVEEHMQRQQEAQSFFARVAGFHSQNDVGADERAERSDPQEAQGLCARMAGFRRHTAVGVSEQLESRNQECVPNC